MKHVEEFGDTAVARVLGAAALGLLYAANDGAFVRSGVGSQRIMDLLIIDPLPSIC